MNFDAIIFAFSLVTLLLFK